MKVTDDDVLLLVDIQNDFCEGGTLAVPHGSTIIPTVHAVAEKFRHVVMTQDWHPPGHICFASAHPGRTPWETITVSYGTQIIMPDHCVQGQPGAAFHEALDVPKTELVIRKGYRTAIDSYSGFFENDRKTPTGLGGYLRERGLKRVFVCGLAFDFCVRYSAEDAAGLGFPAFVIEDASKGLDLNGSDAAARKGFAERGVALIASHTLS